MRLLALLLLSSCSVTEVGDAILPDEFTMGRGRGEHVRYEGESETTYGAFTWHLPSIADEPMSRDERSQIREAALAADTVAEPEIKMNIREGMEPPPASVIYIAAILLLIFVLAVAWKSRRNNQWH